MGWIDKDKGGQRGTGWDGYRKIKEGRGVQDGMDRKIKEGRGVQDGMNIDR